MIKNFKIAECSVISGGMSASGGAIFDALFLGSLLILGGRMQVEIDASNMNEGAFVDSHVARNRKVFGAILVATFKSLSVCLATATIMSTAINGI